MFTRNFLDSLLGNKRAESPKITNERKSKDFDTSSVRSPGSIPRKSTKTQSLYFDESTPELAFSRYIIENDQFAKGAYGKISLAKDRLSNDLVVIKHIPKTTSIRMVQNELRAGQIIGLHPHIAPFHKYIEFPDQHTLVFSYINGEDLFSYMERNKFQPRSELEVKAIISSIANAIKYSHSKAIAHRDIKLENILIDKKGKAYLIDFGLCAFVDGKNKNKEWCGSDNYIAPELCRRIPYDAYKLDVFSLGVTLFALLFGVFPIEGLRVSSKYHDPTKPLQRIQVRFPSDVKASIQVKDLIVQMLEDDPDRRISIDDVLKHKWLAASKTPKILKRSSESNFKFIRKLRME